MIESVRPQGNLSQYDHAIGLSYASGQDDAPMVEISQSALNADEVVRLARRFGVPVVEHPDLVEALSGAPLDSQIPPELYEAVALVLHELRPTSGSST